MFKFHLYFDKDAETEWLNRMAAEGWEMKSFFAGFYHFEQCEKGKYAYQIDFGDRLFAVSDEYREFMQEAGVEIVQTWGYWVILRRLSSEGEFRLYTDVESSIEHYTKIRRMFKAATAAELICLLIELCAWMNGGSLALVSAFILCAIIILFIQALVRVNNIISELKERQTGIAEKKRRNVSPLIAAGLLMNSCALLLEETVPDQLHRVMQIFAIVCMLAGLYLTCKKRDEEE